jgi:hypothetical protein
MTVKLKLWPIVFVSSLALAAPSDSQTMTDRRGICAYSVPGSWKQSGTFAVQPDGHARASATSGAYTPADITAATASFKKQTLEQDAHHVLYRITITGELAAFATLEYYEAIFKDGQGCIVRSNTDLKNPAPLETALRQIASSARFK